MFAACRPLTVILSDLGRGPSTLWQESCQPLTGLLPVANSALFTGYSLLFATNSKLST